MVKKEKKTDDEPIPVFQPFVLPDRGMISLRKLADYVGIEKVKDLVTVLPDGAVIVKMDKLSHSLIDLKELQKCLITVGSMRQPVIPVQQYVPPQVVQQPAQTGIDEGDE